ncbi:helix-turn-helix domain-containing protein [Novosphingobium terrae]|uniref:helix-turn-helix domain-containing protein n=1 Tax=Novosphingobium terrae TaxID=2726189 RepID=UPI0019808832|nr:helix-turn-helix domain-containing protein [Novosphingobium terrae]
MGREVLSTRELPLRRQLDCWNDWAMENWQGIAISSREAGFPADLVKCEVGNIRFSRVRSCSSRVRRQARGTGPQRMILHFQEGGATRNRQCGREATLGTGDLTLLRLDDHYDLDTSRDVSLLIAEFDEQALRDRVGAAAIRGAIHLDAAVPAVGLVGQMLTTLVSEAPFQAGDQAGALLERSFLDMVALAVLSNDTALAGRGAGALFRRTVAEIERSPDDAELSGQELARRLGVTQRALQMAFAEAGTTPSAYLMDRRLDLAAQRLASRPESITRIALDCGFASSAHFSRCFARRFGVSPRDYRQQQGAPRLWR